MGNYFFTVALACIFVGVLVTLFPDGQTGKIGKYISFLCALVICLVILSPLPDLVFGKKEFDILNGISDTNVSEDSSQYKEEYLARLATMTLSEIYGTSTENIKAYVYLEDNGEIEKIVMSVNDQTIFDVVEAGEILSEICKINIEIEKK